MSTLRLGGDPHGWPRPVDGRAACSTPKPQDEGTGRSGGQRRLAELLAVRVVAPGAAVAVAEEGALHAARHQVVVAGVDGIDEQSSRGGHGGIVAVRCGRVDGRCPEVPCDIGPVSPRLPGCAACERSPTPCRTRNACVPNRPVRCACSGRARPGGGRKAGPAGASTTTRSGMLWWCSGRRRTGSAASA